MSSTMKLKDEARRYEQQDDWGRAIELYRRVLEEETGDAELGLYNRIGDLYLRLGESSSAVEYYIQAADRYAEAGFLNNAIALCNKALRYDDARLPLYEKLGKLCAEQGFLTDARRWYLEYGERLAAAGRMDESLNALAEFAALSQDPDVWARLGRQYAAQGRADDATSAFGRAAAAYAAAGKEESAEEIAEEARALDPSFVPPPAAPPAPTAKAQREPFDWSRDSDALDPDALSGAALAGGAAEPPAAGPYESDVVDFAKAATPAEEAEDFGEPAEAWLEGQGAQAPEYESLSVDSLLGESDDVPAPVGPEDGESYDDAVALAAEEKEDDEPLPLLAEDDAPMPMPEWTDVAGSGSEAHEFAAPVVAGEEARGEGERLEEGFETLERAAPDSPLGDDLLDDLDLSIPATPAASGADTLDGLDIEPLPGPEVEEEPLPEFEAGIPVETAAAGEDPLAASIPEEFLAPRTPADRARALIDEGREDDALDILEHAAGAAEEREATQEALRLVDLMVDLAPRSLRALRLRADTARRADDRGRLVSAYVALAQRLRDAGDASASREAYERVLAVEPDHAGARAALAEEAAPTASAGDYVDLAALVGDETHETTRFVVEEEVPTGDEDQDFHEMLSQFRSKVSEHVSVEDTASHYDLGIAFKEMGLIDEAIAEFQTALRFGSQRLKVYEELGQCFMEKGDYAIAEKLLRQGSNEMPTDPSELLGVNYHLGRCYEQLDRPDDAREAYERVLSLDIDFRDVSERLARL